MLVSVGDLRILGHPEDLVGALVTLRNVSAFVAFAFFDCIFDVFDQKHDRKDAEQTECDCCNHKKCAQQINNRARQDLMCI